MTANAKEIVVSFSPNAAFVDGIGVSVSNPCLFLFFLVIWFFPVF